MQILLFAFVANAHALIPTIIKIYYKGTKITRTIFKYGIKIISTFGNIGL